MRSKGVALTISVLFMVVVSCGNDNGGAAGTTTDSLAGDTMPVVYPKNLDTSTVVTPPPTNDDNNAYPDSSQQQ